MKLWNISVTRPVTVFMGLICILVLGTISLQQLKLAFLPKVDFPALWVVVNYPNQSPTVLEREVTRPLEEQLSTLKGVQKITSNTGADGVSIRLNFKWGMELDLVRLELGLKVEEAKASLPKDVRQIQIFSFNTEDIPVIEGRISAPGIDLSENYDLLEKHIKQKIERVPGVAQVELGGVLPKEVSIELRLDKINEHNVDVGQVIQKLSNDNVALSAGKVRAGGVSYNLRSLGKIRNLDDFENLPVGANGLKLKDIADVLYEEPPIGYKRHLDGSSALALEVRKESTANTVEVATAVNEVINKEIADDPVLQGVNLLVWNDQAKEITKGLQGLGEAGFYGALFAVLVLYFFLRRLDATLIVASSIPISVFGAFIVLNAMGYTLNILTMMGLMLAVGMLVDNAVVVLESIYQKVQEGEDAITATSEGTREVITALIAATSTTMIVFLTLAVSEENQISVWLGAIGLTICITLAASLVVSTVVIPLFASKILGRRPIKKKDKPSKLISFYHSVLDWTMNHPVKTFFILLVLMVSTIYPAANLDQFEGNSFKTERLAIIYDFNDYFFLSDVEKVAEKVEAYLETKRQEWEVESIYTWMQANEGVSILYFKDDDMPAERFKDIRKVIREELPTVAGVAFRFDDDEGSSDQAIRIQLFGGDSEVLKQVGGQIAQMVNGIKGLHDIQNGERSGKKELQVSVDREQANKYGVNPKTVADVFSFTLGGQYLPRFRSGDRETEVSLSLRIEDRATIEDISNINMGNGVKLGAIANFEYKDRPENIRRVDRKAHHAVRATYEGENFDAMMKEVETRLDEFQFPPGVTWSWSDRILQDQNQMKDMLLNLILALTLVYLVMASLFESLTQPVMILSTIVFSLFGVFWLLFLTKTEFAIMSVIGLMILLGIVVNNGIILMDRINQLRSKGMALKDAVRQGAHDRIRPILMTAATTVIGMIPLAMGSSSTGDAYYFPLARCVIGGLTSSTLLTLVGLPFIIMTSHHTWELIKRIWRGLKTKLSRKRVPLVQEAV